MLYIWLESIRCHTETGEWGDDEPYVIVTAVDLRSSAAVAGRPVPLPESDAILYGPFGGVGSRQTHRAGFQPFWGLDGEERELSNPDDAIFFISLMEQDSGDPEMLRGVVALAANGSLFASLGVRDRAERLKRLIRAIDAARRTPTGVPNLDDRIGPSQELYFTASELMAAENGPAVGKSLRFKGGGGDYTTSFRALNRGQRGWRFCGKCCGLFYDGYPDKGACAAGGGHEARGWTFYLPHHHPIWLGGQGDWHHCDRCRGMFWAHDTRDQGRCAAGGVHRAQGWPFFVPHDHQGPGQDQWRYCDKCRAMFWNGRSDKGTCPAGGAHNAQGFDFRLDYEK